MKKRIALVLIVALLISAMAGCAGTTVVIGECTCPDEGQTVKPAEGALKTGLAIVGDISGSKNPEGENSGEAKYDVTVVAVTVDENGVICSCIIDSVDPNGSVVKFDATGTITSDVSVTIQTKNELGEAYGMKAYGNSKYEWNEQAKALADYAVGKTVEELKNGAVNEAGKAKDADLATVATIRIDGYVNAIEKAAANARHLGAQAEDELKLAVISSLGSSVSATADKAGIAQLDCDVVALTVNDGVITSCYIDSLQAKVSFDATGVITSDLSVAPQTKNELGEGYGMKAWGQAKFEWNEQAENFANYVTGKTAAEVAGIAINESDKPADGTDLAASVTVKINGFQALIAKALS